MSIMSKVKSAGLGVANKLIQPLLEKPPQRISWESYGKWRTFSHKDGRVIFRRYKEQPGAQVVSNSREATLLAQELWGLDIDTKGRLSAPVAPIVREPLLSDRELYLRRARALPMSARALRITPRTPRLR